VITVKDAQENKYTIGYFGDAGWWMTENLRTMDYTYLNGTPTPLVEKNIPVGTATEPRYSYSRAASQWEEISEEDRDSVFLAHEHYGLLYNWAAASGRTDGPGDDTNGLTTSGTTLYRGVCPEGWHLPSDWEWSELEKEIALNPWEYSTQDVAYTFPVGYGNLYSMTAWRPSNGDNSISSHQKYWGRQMKSTELVGTTINTYGTSEPRAKGGFDALLVGTVDINGTADAYGSHTVFWSSSSNSGGIGSSSYGFFSVNRHLDSGYTGMARDYTYRGHLFSVRCKKDD
jgi:uncharacterized protein (TIGR02145 family)